MSFAILAGCAPKQAVPQTGLQVVATTSILADVVRQVGGDKVQVTSLVPLGADEHDFQPTPRDIANLSDADLVFRVGMGLEPFLDQLINNSVTSLTVVDASAGISGWDFSDPLQPVPAVTIESADPHVWMDVQNVIVWVGNIKQMFIEMDPENVALYQANADAYIAELAALDEWILRETSALPADAHQIVSDHMSFGYYARKYGFKVLGAVIPGYSSAAQPSARELAALEDAVTRYGVTVIFTGNTANPALAGRVAQDTGVKLVPLYTGSLSKPDGPASNYLDYMRYNTRTIVQSLGGDQ